MALRIFRVTPAAMTLIEKVKEYRHMYRQAHPDKISVATYFQPVTKYDVFGQPIKEPTLGTLDQLIQEQDKETYQRQMDSWVFYKCLSDGDDYDTLVAMIGNPGDMMPCDGDTHQCVMFCPDFGKCRYRPDHSPKILEQMLQEQEKPKADKYKVVAVAGQPDSTKPAQKKKRKKKK